MKPYRIISWILCMCILCFFVSCQTNPDTDLPQDTQNLSEQNTPAADTVDTNITEYVYPMHEMRYYKGALYFHNGKTEHLSLPREESMGTLVRYNIDTGNITAVCSDPLCMHTTEECPFAGYLSRFAIIDNTVFFEKKNILYSEEEGFYLRKQYISYDMDTMRWKVLREEEALVGNQTTAFLRALFHGKYWYSNEYVLEKKPDGSEITTGGVMRMDLEKGGVSCISEGKNLEYTQMLFIVNDRIYFSNPESIFSTNLELEDKIVHVKGTFVGNSYFTNGEHIFYGSPVDMDNYNETLKKLTTLQKIYRYDLDGQNPVDLDILSLTGQWFLTEQYIYYVVVDESPTVKEIGGMYLQKALYRCKHDGTEKEKVFDLHRYESDMDTPNIMIALYHPVVVGDSVYSKFFYWEDLNQDGVFDAQTEHKEASATSTDTCSIIHLDLATNTYEIIYPMQ